MGFWGGQKFWANTLVAAAGLGLTECMPELGLVGPYVLRQLRLGTLVAKRHWTERATRDITLL